MKLIDIGCFNGDSTLHFISYPDITSIEAFDPNPDFKDDIWKAITEHYPNITFHNKAVYIKNGTVKYTQRPAELPLGSTIMEAKHGWGMGEIKEVPCVDILDLINEKCCLKVDAEGAEYDILERLIESGRSDLIDRLYVEWHDTKMSSDNEQRQVEIALHFGKRIKQWL